MSEDMLNAMYISPSRFHMMTIITTYPTITSMFRDLNDKLMLKIRKQKKQDILLKYEDAITEVESKNNSIINKWTDLNDKPNIKRKRSTNYLFKSLLSSSNVQIQDDNNTSESQSEKHYDTNLSKLNE